jgi:Predicted kinase related to galactokinase and mevalonate kinase
MAINYYTYITFRIKPNFQDKQFRILWRLAEEVDCIKDIKHPIVRETLKLFKYEKGLDISYIGDLPGGSGMGSSSAFTAALVKAIYEDMRKEINPYELAKISYNIEKNKLNETVGVQDQIATSFGGFNSVNINKDGSYQISPLNLSTYALENFLKRLILVYTGQTRRATDIAESKVKNIASKENEFKILQDMVSDSKKYLSSTLGS